MGVQHDDTCDWKEAWSQRESWKSMESRGPGLDFSLRGRERLDLSLILYSLNEGVVFFLKKSPRPGIEPETQQ